MNTVVWSQQHTLSSSDASMRASYLNNRIYFMTSSTSKFDIGAVDLNGGFIFHSYVTGTFVTSNSLKRSIELIEDVVYFM